MRSAEDIRHLIKNARIIINPEIKKAALKELIKELRKPKTIGTATTKPAIWRIIMKSPITKIAAVAAVVIACLTGLFFWKSTGSGIVLADVLARVEQVTSYRYQVSSTTTKQQVTGTRNHAVLVSRDHGLKMTITEVDANEIASTRGTYSVGDEWYILLQSSSIVTIRHEKKLYNRLVFDDAEIDFYKEQYNDPRTVVAQILDCEHTSMGPSVIDKTAVEGFQTTDPNYGGGFFGKSDRVGKLKKVDVRLWVDIDTLLPIRLEEDVITENGVHVHEVNYDFQWNVAIKPEDFEPKIPEGYQAPVGDLVIRGGQENAIDGLRLFAEAVGKYPDSLELKAFSEEYEEHFAPDPNLYEGLPEDERTTKINEGLAMLAPTMFYLTLVEEGKEPVYYGKTVSINDTTKVLLKWKQEEGQYGVILGDLSVRSVTTQELAKLEGGG